MITLSNKFRREKFELTVLIDLNQQSLQFSRGYS